MNEASIIQYITGTFDGLETVLANGDTFIMYDPERKFPMVTLVTSDYNDSFSNLNRPGVFRLNIGISKQTFLSLFGSKAKASAGEGDSADGVGNDYDFTALDQLMPHPVYGMMYWVCILNPTEVTFEALVKPLLAEAYEMAVSKYAKRASRG